MLPQQAICDVGPHTHCLPFRISLIISNFLGLLKQYYCLIPTKRSAFKDYDVSIKLFLFPTARLMG